MNHRLTFLSKVAVWVAGAMFLLGGCTASLLENELESSETIEVVTIESLSIQLKDLSKSMSDYKQKLNQLASYIIAMQNKVNELDDQAYSDLKLKVDEMEGKVTAFEDALKNLEGFTDVNTWVNDLNAGLNSLSALQVAVNEAKDGITGIVTRLNGLDEVTAGIAANLNTKTEAILADLESCSADISGILTRLGALEGSVAALQAEIAALISSVQSVVIVPDYSDGSVWMNNMTENTVRFEIQPLSAAQRLVEIGQSAFSFDYVETTTKSSALHHLPITSVSFDGEFVVMKVDASAISDGKSINARLLISDGKIVRSSEYFYITYVSYPDVTILSVNETANCYIVSSEGNYCFPAVKGNSSESVGDVASAEVLWESFGTDVAPSMGDIVAEVSSISTPGYHPEIVRFSTPSTLKNGNAVIAAKDAGGEILWSWHIWVCKDYDPIATTQVYYNDAGVMMDRNLGATSATPGDVSSYGLLYQWGRKDPFLGAGSYSSSSEKAASTGVWPEAVASDMVTGTIDCTLRNPMTFVTYSGGGSDWYYLEGKNGENTRWQNNKTIYDPCPSGWRVPDGGGATGVWAKAFGGSYGVIGSGSSFAYPTAYSGMNFSGKLGDADVIWYPIAGELGGQDGRLRVVLTYGSWWTCTPHGTSACNFMINQGYVFPGWNTYRSTALSVRCLKVLTPSALDGGSLEGFGTPYED